MNRLRAKGVVGLYVTAHRVHQAGLVIVLLGLVIVLTANTSVGIADTTGRAVTYLVELMPALMAVAVVIPLGVHVPQLEEMRTRVLPRAEWALFCSLLGLSFGVSLLSLVGASVVGGRAVPWALVLVLWRATVGWAGLALVSAALLRPVYGWVLPLIALPLSALFGYNAAGEARPWNLGAAPVDSPGAWLLVVGMTLAGCLLWRLDRWTRWNPLRLGH